jgi:sulfur transfer protein SufE
MNNVNGLTFFVPDNKLVEMMQGQDLLQKTVMKQINGLMWILNQYFEGNKARCIVGCRKNNVFASQSLTLLFDGQP